jgi:predicted MPP superfamily phosphohydrolase
MSPLWQPDRVDLPGAVIRRRRETEPLEPARRAGRRLSAGVAAVGGASATGLAYAWLEARWFTVLEETLPVLPPGAPDLRVLHVSDLHLTPYQRRKRAWISSLAELEPDLVVDTGDNLAHQDSVEPLVDALGGLLDVPGVFVQGSNDYFEPTLRNPVRYLLPDDGSRATHSPTLPWRDMVRRFTEAGWVELTNRCDELTVKGVRLAFAGVDDPHLGYDDLASVAGEADAGADVRVGVAHAPYLRVLDQLARDGYDAILAGHTHGGQLCLPGRRAIVTNCDLDRGRASGLSTHPAAGDTEAPGTAWLHVCPGAGTSPYAVARFCCRPAASLLTLTARS